MNTFGLFGIVILAAFALLCLIVAFAYGAWWHLVTGTIFAGLAGAIYSEEKTRTL